MDSIREGAHTIAGAQIGAWGLSPASPLTLTTGRRRCETGLQG